MLRRSLAYALSGLLVLAGLSLAQARGSAPLIGTEMLICSGATFTTIALGPDGRPVERPAPCPDGNAIFTATFGLSALLRPGLRRLAGAALPGQAPPRPGPAPVPAARGPPVRF